MNAAVPSPPVLSIYSKNVIKYFNYKIKKYQKSQKTIHYFLLRKLYFKYSALFLK